MIKEITYMCEKCFEKFYSEEKAAVYPPQKQKNVKIVILMLKQ